MKLRLTVVHEYEAVPEYYGTDDPKEMAKIDEVQWADILNMAIQDPDSAITAKIEPVEE